MEGEKEKKGRGKNEIHEWCVIFFNVSQLLAPICNWRGGAWSSQCTLPHTLYLNARPTSKMGYHTANFLISALPEMNDDSIDSVCVNDGFFCVEEGSRRMYDALCVAFSRCSASK